MEEDNSRFHWTSNVTKLLIEGVRRKISTLNKKNNFEKKIWKEISLIIQKEGYDVNEDQCCTKWKNMKQKYRNVKDNNNKTGASKESWEYYELMQDIMDPLPEVNPLSLASSTGGFRLQTENVCLKKNAFSNNNELESENEENIEPNTFLNTQNVRRLKRKKTTHFEKLYMQRERHQKENKALKEKFLTLFEEYIRK